MQTKFQFDINTNVQEDNNSEQNFDGTEDMANFEFDLTMNLDDLQQIQIQKIIQIKMHL